MKKSLVFLLGFLFLATYTQAQEEGAKLAKQAGKALTSYNIDPTNNAAKLEEAKTKINQALQFPDAQALSSAWITKGEIYNTTLQRDMVKRQFTPDAPLTGDNDALEAVTAYMKGYELATKKYEKSDAIKGITDGQGHLINIGVTKYEAGEFEKAFLSFKAALQSHEVLKANSQKSLLDEKEQYDNQVYITGLAALLAKRTDDAVKYYEMLYNAGTDKAAIYEGLYNIKSEKGDEAGADKILVEGRKKFPDDAGLLFAEINSYLKKGKLEDLTDRLKQAIAQEPNNVQLYVTLGNVYDNLYQREQQAKNVAKAEEYFTLAKKQYSDAQAKDPKNVDAVYSLGALYYNKAAFRTQELNALPEDFHPQA
jgi:tetratricopeptide (TPR) repeat protein